MGADPSDRDGAMSLKLGSMDFGKGDHSPRTRVIEECPVTRDIENQAFAVSLADVLAGELEDSSSQPLRTMAIRPVRTSSVMP